MQEIQNSQNNTEKQQFGGLILPNLKWATELKQLRQCRTSVRIDTQINRIEWRVQSQALTYVANLFLKKGAKTIQQGKEKIFFNK